MKDSLLAIASFAGLGALVGFFILAVAVMDGYLSSKWLFIFLAIPLLSIISFALYLWL